MNFAKEYTAYKELVDKYLDDAVNDIKSPDAKLFDAVKYALFCGGKRLRPVLFLAICDFFSTAKSHWQTSEPKTAASHPQAVRFVVCAIEMLHTYTLIHDDMPCLDNDDFRRGKPSCHKRYGEATALLAGDSLLNLCYEFLLNAAVINPQIISGATKFSSLCGIGGLIGGQSAETRLDYSELNNFVLSSKNYVAKKRNSDKIITEQDKKINESEQRILDIYKNKTAALFEASALMGTVCAGAACDEEKVRLINTFAKNFGMAFQLKDDIADMDQNSFAYIFGEERVNKLLSDYSQKALDAAKALEFDFLEKLVSYEKHL